MLLAAATDILTAGGALGTVVALGGLVYKYIDIGRGQRKILDEVEDRVQKMLAEEARVATAKAARIEADSKDALARALADCERLVRESDERCDAKLAAMALEYDERIATLHADIEVLRARGPRPRKAAR